MDSALQNILPTLLIIAKHITNPIDFDYYLTDSMEEVSATNELQDLNINRKLDDVIKQITQIAENQQAGKPQDPSKHPITIPLPVTEREAGDCSKGV